MTVTGGETTLLTLLNDAVSDMILNMGFTSAEKKAHEKLVSILVTHIKKSGETMRLLLDSVVKSSKEIDTVDLKHFLKMRNLDFAGLLEYISKVGPFPEENNEDDSTIPSTSKASETPMMKRDVVNSRIPASVPDNHASVPNKIIPNIPRFDEMDEFELGFSYHKTIMPEQPDPSCLHLKDIETTRMADNQRNSENNNNSFKFLAKLPKVSKSTPDLTWKIKPDSKIVKRSESPDNEPSTSINLETDRTSKPPHRVFKRRTVLKNYEKRLREEVLEEKRIKKLKHELRKNEGNRNITPEPSEMEGKDKLMLKISKDVYTEALKNAEPAPKMAVKWQTLSDDEDESLLVSEEVRPVRCELKDDQKIVMKIRKLPVSVQPLPKIRIQFDRIHDGLIIKKVTKITYNYKDGFWKPMRKNKYHPNGVWSHPVPRLPKVPKLPKLRIQRQADGTHIIVNSEEVRNVLNFSKL